MAANPLDLQALMQGGIMAQMPEPPAPVVVARQEPPKRIPPKLKKLMESVNIAADLDEDTLNRIGERVVKEAEIDDESRSDWREMMREAMKVARQVKEAKNTPWPNAANIKYPVIATAAIQFAARAYPEFIRGDKVVDGKVIGKDPDEQKKAKAERIGEFMSWQLLDDMSGWDEDTDRMLHVLPITGLVWRKTYYDPINERPCSEFVLPDDVIVNYWTKSLNRCPRITHRQEFYPNEIYERQAAGIWLDVDFSNAQTTENHTPEDDSAPIEFYEQIRLEDLDGDGYQEPYIVTVHKDSSRVVRIYACYDEDSIQLTKSGKLRRIEPFEYWTKYGFIPAPDGSFYDIGFGVLLNPLNETINTLCNQLIDAGTLANTGGGFIGKGPRGLSGPIKFKPGEWKQVDAGGTDLKNAIVPLPVREPSAVLFNLLSLLLEAANKLSTVSDEMTGQKTSPNEPATSTLARIEQGMKVFNGIHKRLYRSMSQEFKKLFRLNRDYLSDEEYQTVLDDPNAVVAVDFDGKTADVKPVADPNISSDQQRMAKAQAEFQIVGAAGGDVQEAGKAALQAVGSENVDRFFPPSDPNSPPSSEQAMAQAKIDEMQKRLEMDMQKQQAQMQLDAAKAEMEMGLKERQMQIDAEIKERSHMRDLEHQAKLREMDHKGAAGYAFEELYTQMNAMVQQLGATQQALAMLAEQMQAQKAVGIQPIRENGRIVGGVIQRADGSQDEVRIQ